MLRVRWLGRVAYRDAHALQHGLFEHSSDDHLLLLEHPHVYTLGVRADPAHILVEPACVGAELVETDRGGDVTYHGPGQLVGYPVMNVPQLRRGGIADTAAYVAAVEDLLIAALARLGFTNTGRLDRYPGVWMDPASARPRKVAAIGVRLSRGRSMHGFALNVSPEMAMFENIVPCGLEGMAVTSLAAEGFRGTMADARDAVVAVAVETWGPGSGGWERADAVEHAADARPAETVELTARKPDWMRVQVRQSKGHREVGSLVHGLGLVTVCEEAGCPNIYECWSDRTATFMLNGDRCTRSCGFCLIDSRRPLPPDPGEPGRVAEAVERMGLEYVVLTTVARDDLPDGGAGQFAATIDAIRARVPAAQVEVLISDLKGDPEALQVVLDARPDVVNHNIETVLRLQRMVRPSASYARSLAVLARAKAAGFATKSGLVLGMGESFDEVVAALADLAGLGVDIVTAGQYLRPSTAQLPVAHWWSPAELDELKVAGEALGIRHVEASPLTRSSHHARSAAAAGLAK